MNTDRIKYVKSRLRDLNGEIDFIGTTIEMVYDEIDSLPEGGDDSCLKEEESRWEQEITKLEDERDKLSTELEEYYKSW